MYQQHIVFGKNAYAYNKLQKFPQKTDLRTTMLTAYGLTHGFAKHIVKHALNFHTSCNCLFSEVFNFAFLQRNIKLIFKNFICVRGPALAQCLQPSNSKLIAIVESDRSHYCCMSTVNGFIITQFE